MAFVEWTMEGVEFVNCNCNLGCPCQFNALPTRGLCEASSVHEIRQGAFGAVSLAGLRFVQPGASGTLTWRAGIDNVLDKRAWRESPFQFGHAYLYPLPQRTLRVSLQADL